MRVPTYQSQGKRTTEVSARQLNVRANPGALAAESQALANFGQTAAKVGQTWYEQSLKAERAGQLKSAENQLDEKLRDVEIKRSTRTQRMSQHSMSKRRRLPSQPSLSGIKDPVVQRRFKGSAATATLNKSVTIFKMRAFAASIRGWRALIPPSITRSTPSQQVAELRLTRQGSSFGGTCS